jgi:hypothetical protein
MKPADDDLSKDARALLRAARGGDDIPAAERQRVLQAFRERARVDAAVEPDVTDREMAARAPRFPGAPAARGRHGRALPRPVRRVAWTLAAAIATGSLAAFAREGAFDGWGAAIEKMLGRLAGGSSTASVEPALEVAAAGEVSPSAAAESRGAQPAADEAGEGFLPSAAAVRPEPGDDDSGSAAAEAATEPAARTSAAPAAARSNASGRQPPPSSSARSRRDRENGRAHLPGAAQVGVPRPPSTAASSREPAREASRGPSASQVRAHDPSASDELELIITARNALAARRHADARTAAERHARQFPRGAFVEEREAILALCACRETGASERARAFIERRPDSLFTERIRQDCRLVSNLVPGGPPAGTH